MPIEPGAQELAFDMMATQARDMAHAIGNPLAGLSLSLELLEQTELQPAQARYVARCRHACERLLADQVRLASLGGGNHQAAGWLDAATVAHEALARVRRAVFGSPHHSDGAWAAELEVAPNASRVWAVAPMLNEALCALVANASEAAGQAGAMGICAERQADMFVFSVWDDGPGVAQEQKERLFRVRTTDKPRGLGLGLIRAALMVERYQGGQLSHKERDPHGAIFSLALPLPSDKHRHGAS